MIAIHHAGESDVEDVRAAMNLARENNVTISTVVDVVDADFGRVLGWSKQAGAVTQPDRGFWSPLGTVGDDAVVVTTGMFEVSPDRFGFESVPATTASNRRWIKYSSSPSLTVTSHHRRVHFDYL
jgi:hypothetical protein